MNNPVRAVILLCAWCVAPWAAVAELSLAAGDGARPSLNEAYENPDFDRWVQIFERPGREVFDRREDILSATGVGTGMEVADVGAGTGLFTRLFAREVGPGGHVYAVDISDEFIANIEQMAAAQGLDNITGIVNTQRSTLLAPQSVDLVFVCDTYHHFEHPKAMLASIHRALRRGGRLIVIDFRKIEGVSSDWVMGHVRAGKEAVIGEIIASGFRLLTDRDLLERNYFLEFEKRPGS